MTNPAPQTAMVKISDLAGNPANYRQHPVEQIEALRHSLRVSGFRKPVVVRLATMQIIAGHGLVAAATAEGVREVPCWVWDCTEEQARRYLVADNELARKADDDAAMLTRLLADIQEADGTVFGTGWDDDELAALLDAQDAMAGPDPADGVDEPPAPSEVADSEPGTLYELGPHRLYCGSSTDADSWTALMGDTLADCVWTDPPYEVSYDGGPKPSSTRDLRKIENDSMGVEELEGFLDDALGMALAHTAQGGAWYVSAPPGPSFAAFANTLVRMGVWRQTLVWDKGWLAIGRSDYHYKHEAIFYGWRPGAAHKWCSDRKQTTVLEFNKPARNADHPTMKPVELVKYCVENNTEPGDLVVDCFGGSGTTLIAAAAGRRKARLIELDPIYCDVIRRRWTRFAKSVGIDPGEGALDG